MSDGDHHVYPVEDLIEHMTDGGDCPCGPTTEPVEREDGSIGYVITHHSLDVREEENAELQDLAFQTAEDNAAAL
jgi:hypothetical protein